MEIHFITSVFGDRHVSMLIPLLYSIEQTNPQAAISVYWEDIQKETKDLIQQSFPQVEFVETHFNFTSDIAKRISSKTLVWELAAHDKRNEPGWLFFMDADMLVLRKIGPLLSSFFHTDVVYTFRQGQFWINSGVLACRQHAQMADFFKLWREKTQEILNNKFLFAQANDKQLHYGGADQMSLQKILGYSVEKNACSVPILTDSIRFSGIECGYLNETHSRPITEKTHVIHYKGGWRDILFFGGNFTSNRPKWESWEMYILYLRTFQKAIHSINNKLATHYSCRDFGLVIPWYLDKHTLREVPCLYPLYVVSKNMQTFFPRLQKYLLENIFSRS